MLTIALCTWNRSTVLEKALHALTEMVRPAGLSWEVIVVDNNSTDDTGGVLARFQDRLPLRPVREATPGASHARNRAVSEARGEAILWTDDDAIVDPDWLAAYAQALTASPGVALFGGPIRPLFEVPPPAWLVEGWDSVSGAYAVRDLGPNPLALDTAHVPYGPNYAVRTGVHRQFQYDTTLGPTTGGNIRGEETALIRAVLNAGHLGQWVPEARVSHLVPASRQTVSYLRRYYEGSGLTEARTLGELQGPLMFGVPRWMWRRAVTKEVLYRWRRLTQPARAWVPAMTEASIAWGLLKGAERR
jgi:glucosyl-dolichyl phosphate glucuronosyltransferase